MIATVAAAGAADPTTTAALISTLVALAAAIVVLATIRRTWSKQTVEELKNLADAQAARIDFLEAQLRLMTEQLTTVQAKLTAMELDSLSLVRRNRELAERLRRHGEEF